MTAARRVMDETRDHFLAGAGFTGEQDGGFRLRHAGRLRKDVPPLFRVADDATLTGAFSEFAPQRGDLRFETGRGFA